MNSMSPAAEGSGPAAARGTSCAHVRACSRQPSASLGADEETVRGRHVIT